MPAAPRGPQAWFVPAIDPIMPEITIDEVARLAEGRIEGAAEGAVRGVAPLESAGPQDLSFVANPRYLPYLQGTRAGVVLVPETLAGQVPARLPRVVVKDAHLALYRVLPALYPPGPAPRGIHPTAVVAPDAELGAEVSVGPYAVVGAGCRIGDRTRIGAHVVVGDGTRVGDDCVIHPQASLYAGVVVGDRCVIQSGARLGREGFGFVWAEGGHRKIPQVGGCVLGDDVEVGTNVTIDRGSIGDTVVGSGTKIDSLVHLAHNAKVGQHVILVAQVGVSGSTSIGDGAVLGGQAGVGGHLSIGARARIGAQAGVTGNVPAGETYSGYPARPHGEAMRALGALFRLPDLVRRVRALERALPGREKTD